MSAVFFITVDAALAALRRCCGLRVHATDGTPVPGRAERHGALHGAGTVGVPVLHGNDTLRRVALFAPLDSCHSRKSRVTESLKRNAALRLAYSRGSNSVQWTRSRSKSRSSWLGKKVLPDGPRVRALRMVRSPTMPIFSLP